MFGSRVGAEFACVFVTVEQGQKGVWMTAASVKTECESCNHEEKFYEWGSWTHENKFYERETCVHEKKFYEWKSSAAEKKSETNKYAGKLNKRMK